MKTALKYTEKNIGASSSLWESTQLQRTIQFNAKIIPNITFLGNEEKKTFHEQ